MNSQAIVQLVISSGILSLIGWGIKRTIDSAMKRWTERIEKAELAVIAESGKREALALAMQTKHDELHDQIDALREKTVQREDWIRESTRVRQTLDRLIEGQARMEGKLDIGTQIAASLRAAMEGTRE